jgi:hypothetical protein
VLTAAAPLSLFASDCLPPGTASFDTTATLTPGLADKLVISGRIVDADRNAVARASIEAPFAENARTTSDADGRFMLVIDRRSAEVAQSMQLKIAHAEHRTQVARLGLSRKTHVAHHRAAGFERDESGAWRTALSFVLG